MIVVKCHLLILIIMKQVEEVHVICIIMSSIIKMLSVWDCLQEMDLKLMQFVVNLVDTIVGLLLSSLFVQCSSQDFKSTGY